MSHEGERAAGMRMQDQPDCVPPHWLNPLVGPFAPAGADARRLRAYAKAPETRQTTPETEASVMNNPIVSANQAGTSPPEPRNTRAVTKNPIEKIEAK
jgi:hypothetical protein